MTTFSSTQPHTVSSFYSPLLFAVKRSEKGSLKDPAHPVLQFPGKTQTLQQYHIVVIAIKARLIAIKPDYNCLLPGVSRNWESPPPGCEQITENNISLMCRRSPIFLTPFPYTPLKPKHCRPCPSKDHRENYVHRQGGGDWLQTG